MKEELQNLLDERQKCLKTELGDNHWSKLTGEESNAGCKVEIRWVGLDCVDHGYLFDLPIGNSSDEADIFVHIPKPENPSGIDTPPPVFTTLYQLMLNDQVKSIIVITN